MLCYTTSSQSPSAEGGGDYFYTYTLSSSKLAKNWVSQSTGVLKADIIPPGGVEDRSYAYGYGQEMEVNKDYSASSVSYVGGDVISSATLPSSSSCASTSLLPTVAAHISPSRSQGLPDSTPRPKPKRRRKSHQKEPGKTAKNKERHFVQHNYHDLATEPDTTIGSDHESHGLSDDAFPMRLHRMLDEVENEGYAHIISWQPHGRAFIIRDTSLFSQIIMPKYFPTSKKMTSIQRQFNLYGFEKLTRDGPDHGAYYHEAFLRGRPGLSARRMVRKRVKGTGHKACSNPDAEPDFFSMPFVAVSGCGSSSSVNGTIIQASAAPTLDGMRSEKSHDDYYYYQGILNQRQHVQPLISSSQQMFQSYSAPTSRDITFQYQPPNAHTRRFAEETDDEPIDLFHFDWGDAEMFRS
jgi:hypothetical protein